MKNPSLLPSILLVDDQEDLLIFLSALLKDDFRIWKAYNGKEACEILDNQIIHIVVSDIMMPDMDGFQLCEWIKDNPNTSHIHVILLTAKDTLESKIEGLKKGADVYLEKPFSTEHLIVQIHNVLYNRTLIKDSFTKSPLSNIYLSDLHNENESFAKEIKKLIFDNIDKPEFDINSLAKLLHTSRPTLYRKVKSVFNFPPNKLINVIRLNNAADLIAKEFLTIGEVAEQVGYNSLSQFGRHFLRQFKMTPSQYKEKVKSSVNSNQDLSSFYLDTEFLNTEN